MWSNKKSNLEETLDKLVKAEEKIYEARDVSRKFFFRMRAKFYKAKHNIQVKLANFYKRIKKIIKR
ncbi:hypothetical protein KKD70_00860 [Patescibacteria group bacterium]|nr:hypothetical protein [Patescibacteria group bacterium]